MNLSFQEEYRDPRMILRLPVEVGVQLCHVPLSAPSTARKNGISDECGSTRVGGVGLQYNWKVRSRHSKVVVVGNRAYSCSENINFVSNQGRITNGQRRRRTLL